MKKKIVILRRKQVEEQTGLKRSTIYDYLKNNTFPKPIKLGGKSAGWIESEIQEWIMEQIKKTRE